MTAPVEGEALIEELVKRALAARANAYAPYSEYKVGCALAARGQIFEGANVENSSYGMTLCAERNAVARAVYELQRDLDIVVVATNSSPPAAPCGMCLQAINEFSRSPESLRIILVNPQGERREFTLHDLLPHGFRPEQLEDQLEDVS